MYKTEVLKSLIVNSEITDDLKVELLKYLGEIIEKASMYDDLCD